MYQCIYIYIYIYIHKTTSSSPISTGAKISTARKKSEVAFVGLRAYRLPGGCGPDPRAWALQYAALCGV